MCWGSEVVLPDGSLVHLGGKTLDAPGYDLAGVFVGSEGTLGIATKITLRIVKRPECVRTLLAAFHSPTEAGAAVSGIIAAGMLPAAIEMMDNLAIQAAEAAVHANYPDCGGLLLVELDGPVAEVDALMAHVDEICRQHGAWEIRVAQSEAERALVWKGRKAAFAAMGRISPNYIVQDGVIPRTSLPQILSEIDQLSAETGLRVANVFHAGDGNLHPLVLYDRRIPGQEKAAERLSERILELCIEKGGSITGEHGVGEEKKHMMSKMFAEPDLDTMQRVRCAFDPLQLSNPTKVFPRTRLCGEKPGEYVPHPLEIAGRGGAVLSIEELSGATVVEPADEKETAAMLRSANETGQAVIPTGGGTKLDWGNPPRKADVLLSMRPPESSHRTRLGGPDRDGRGRLHHRANCSARSPSTGSVWPSIRCGRSGRPSGEFSRPTIADHSDWVTEPCAT